MDYFTKMGANLVGKKEDLELLEKILAHFMEDHEDVSADSLKEDGIEVSAETAAAYEELAGGLDSNPGVYVELQDPSGHHSLWISQDESVSIDALGPIIQIWMREVGYEKSFVFEYAHTASRATPDSYGGGAVLISRDAFLWENSKDAIEHLEEEAARNAEIAAGTRWAPESHWDDHDEFPVADWQAEVENGDTRQSYVDWVNSQMALRAEDEAEPDDEAVEP